MRIVKILAAIVGVIVVLIVGALVYASTIDFNRYKPQIIAAAKDATGRELEIKGDLKLAIGLRPAVAVDGVSFQNAAWGEKRPMVSIQRFEAQVSLLPLIFSLGKNVVVDRLVLRGADVLLETDAQGKGNWEFQTAGAPKPAQPAPAASGGGATLPAINLIELRDVKLAFRDGAAKKTTSLALERMLGEIDGSTLKLDVAGVYNKLAFAVHGRTGRLVDVMGIGGSGPFPIDLNLALGDRVKATLKGRIAQVQQAKGIDIAFTTDIPDAAKLADVASDAGVAAAVPLSGPIKLAARITDPAPGSWSLSDLKFEGAGSDLAGQLQVAGLAGGRHAITGDFKSNKLDLAKLTAGDGRKPAAAPARPAQPAARSDRVFPDDPLPFDAMKSNDADVKLAIAELVLPNAMVAKTVQVALTLKNGDLSVAPLRTLFGGGQIDGDVKLTQAGALTAKLKGAGLDLGQLVKESSGADNLTGGKTELDLDVRGNGKSVRQLMAGLNGRFALTVGEGSIKSAFVDRVGLDDLVAIINKSLPKEDSFRLNCVVSRIDIASGVATHRTMVIDTARLTANGDGRINLGSEQLDMKLDTRTKVTSLLSALPPILVKGTLANPSFQPDVLGAAAGIAGAVTGGAGGAASGGLGGIVGAVTGQRPAQGGGQQATAGGGDPCATALGRAQPASAPAAAPSQPAQQQPAQQPAQQPSGGGGLLPGGLPNPFRR